MDAQTLTMMFSMATFFTAVLIGIRVEMMANAVEDRTARPRRMPVKARNAQCTYKRRT